MGDKKIVLTETDVKHKGFLFSILIWLKHALEAYDTNKTVTSASKVRDNVEFVARECMMEFEKYMRPMEMIEENKTTIMIYSKIDYQPRYNYDIVKSIIIDKYLSKGSWDEIKIVNKTEFYKEKKLILVMKKKIAKTMDEINKENLKKTNQTAQKNCVDNKNKIA